MKNQRKSIVPAIQWHEGMLLAPHHFQQLDMRYSQAVSYHMQLISPFHWGMVHYEIDQVLLPSGILRLVVCEAVMPDGLIVNYRNTQHPVVEVDLSPYKAFLAEENWNVYLGIAESSEEISGLAGDSPRYYSWEGEDVSDENVADNVIRIPRLLPRLHLLLSQKPPSRFLSFPLLKVGLREESYITLPYIPPSFAIELDSPLGKQCAAFAQHVREKVAYLNQRWQNQTGSVLSGETADILRPLLQVLPILEGVMRSQALHPYQLYQHLCTVAGYLTTLRLGQLPPPYPAYDHEDILGSLVPLLEQMEGNVNNIEQHYLTIPFQQEARFFFLPITHEFLKADSLLIGMRGSGNMSDGELEDWIQGAVIASDSRLESIKAMRITGAKRSIVKAGAIGNLLPGKGCVILRVENDPAHIVAAENLNIFNMGDREEKRPTDIVFYIKNNMSVEEDV
ncbi:MAG: type VI secretion system baseplate subunit TssK [Alphaproteobacteria bacterium]